MIESPLRRPQASIASRRQICVAPLSVWPRVRSRLHLLAHADATATRQLREARWDPLTGRPRTTASRNGPAIELTTAHRQLAIDGLLLRAGGVVTITVPRST